MIRTGNNRWFSDADWSAAKEEARRAMIARSKAKGVIAYSELVEQITSIKFNWRDIRLNALLEAISIEEDEVGRGMLSAVVVSKRDEWKPGWGFFKLAKKLGRTTRDQDKCWLKELNDVHAIWSSGKK